MTEKGTQGEELRTQVASSDKDQKTRLYKLPRRQGAIEAIRPKGNPYQKRVLDNPFHHMDTEITRWSTPKSVDYILCSQRWRSSIQSAKTRPGDDCGSEHELLIAKFRVKLKKVEKTTRPFRYDLNQIPYNYTVEVRNRFKGQDLIDKVPDALWTEVHDIV